MSRASKRRQKRKSGTSSLQIPLRQKLTEFWKGKSPVFRFFITFLLLMAVFYMFWYTDFFQDYILQPWNDLNAWVGAGILSIFGQETTSNADSISGGGFSIQVRQGCDALEPTALFVSGVLAFPAAWKYKLKGIPMGIVFLLSINLIRIISLFLVGKYWPAGFEFMHVEVWQVVFILLALIAWAYWLSWSNKAEKNEVASSTSD